MKTLRIQERQVTVASFEQRWLYVYSGIKRQHIFSFQDDIVDFCLDEAEDSSWLLWAVSLEGWVYRIAETAINQQRASESCASNTQVNNGIFEELFQDLPDAGFTSSSEPSSHISPKDVIFKVDPKGAAVCAHTDVLAIATIKKKSCILNIFAKKDLTSNDGPKEPCFTTTLCLPNPGFDDISLYIVASLANSCLSGSGNLRLEPLVFNSLFGTQTSLLDSAVILLTLSDGHVYYLPLKRWLQPSQQNNGDLSILCDLNSPIAKIFVLDVETVGAAEDPPDHLSVSQLLSSFREPVSRFPALVVCALSGQCCLFSAPTNFKTNFQVMQKTVLKDGPIVTCCLGDGTQQFLYSTSKNIVTVAFSFAERLEISEQVCTRLAGIKNMAALIVKDETLLLCQSENGRFYSLPKSNDGFGTCDPVVCPKNTIPNLLARVDDITRKMDQINPNIKCQSHILSQLALASHLSLNVSASTSVNRQIQHEGPQTHTLQGSVSVKRTNGITTLCCQVTSSKTVLSSDWLLVVETHPISLATEETVQKANFKSVRLKQGLHPGESVEVTIAPNLETPFDSKLSINAWLVLNVQLHNLSLYSSPSHVAELKALEDQGFAILVFGSQTDFLDFLVCKESLQSDEGLDTENKHSTPVSSVIDSIARKRPVYSAFEDIPTLVTGNLQEKLTYKMLIPDHLSAFLSDHTCQDVTHKSCLLKDLLCKLKIPCGKETSAATTTIDTTDWGQVTLGIQKSNSETNQYSMEIHAGSPGTLVEMVLALMRHIKKLLPTGLAKTLDVSKFITEIQNAKATIRSIEEDLTENKELLHSEKVMNRLLYFFLDVHNIDYQLSCHLYV